MKTLHKKFAALKTISSKIVLTFIKSMLFHKRIIQILTMRNGWTVQQNQLLPTPSLICCSPLHTVYPEL